MLLRSACTNGFADGINVVGVFPGKALVSIDGGPPRTLILSLSTGQKAVTGITVLALSADTATFAVDGQHPTLPIGPPFHPAAGAGSDAIVLALDARGQDVPVGAIDGRAATLLVDTEASVVVFGAPGLRH